MKKKIKSFFKNHPGIKIKSRELSKKIKATNPEDYALLKSTLYMLQMDGFLFKKGKRYSQAHEGSIDLVGVFQLSRKGNFGFVILGNSKLNDIFIPEKYFLSAVHGDKVKVELLSKQRGKSREGKIVSVVERKNNEIIGTLTRKKKINFVYPDNKEINKDIYIPENYLNKAKDGDKVVIGEIEWETKGINPEGKVIEVIGKAGDYKTEISLIAREFNFSTSFPKNVIKELKPISDSISTEEMESRLDLRELTTFTIDPEDAKDFDDALSVEILPNKRYRVGIHIADVSHYVTKDKAIYNEALKRSTSVYLVGSVIPMLPEKLSTDICSLVPNKDRLTFSVIADIGARGKIYSYRICKTIINSNKRFTYENAQKILDEKSGEYYNDLKILNNLALQLRVKRIAQGSINFVTPEIKFQLDKKGKPTDISLKKSIETNSLVEEFMLLANKIVASHIKSNENKSELPFVYRVHDEPEEEKILEFERFVSSLGYVFNSKAKNKSKELQKLLNQIHGSSEESVINEIAIRSMAKAMYSTNNVGHYGLGFKNYSHFTSPIRRFPDLIVHKLIYKYLDNFDKELYSLKELENICRQTSNQERNAVAAERLSIKLKQIEYLKNYVGNIFNGIISGVTNYGIFIEVEENLAEGLIRLRDLEDDYYLFDEKQYSLIGSTSGKTLRLGDKVKVKLTRADEEKQEIDFILAD